MNRRWWPAALVLAAGAARALEIPVSRPEDKAGPTRVGYVDMERIFREYPETRKAREEFRKEAARYKTELAERERELDALRRSVDQPPPPAASTGTAAALEESLKPPPATAEDLKKRTEDLEKARAAAAQALKDYEERQSKQILGRLYKALVQVAEERGISLVVDKAAILYGQSAVDLTEALSRRVRGLPEEPAP